MWVYKASTATKHGSDRLFTVGFYKPDGTWEPESDWNYAEEAAARVNYLNGGSGAPPWKPREKINVPESVSIRKIA